MAESMSFDRSRVFFFKDFLGLAFLGANDTASGGFLTTGTGLGFGILTTGFSGGFFSTGCGFAGAGAGPPAAEWNGEEMRVTRIYEFSASHRLSV